jgi:hypothetical protein
MLLLRDRRRQEVSVEEHAEAQLLTNGAVCSLYQSIQAMQSVTPYQYDESLGITE